MKKSVLLLVASLYGTVAAGSALAMNHGDCPAGKGWMPPVEEMDTDKNGAVSAAEMKAFHKKHFDEADTNKDGSLDTKEFQVMHEKKMAKRHEAKFKRMDTDGNGKLSQDELSKKKDMGMKQCDKDANGDLSKAELDACHPGMPGMQKQHGMNMGGAHPAVPDTKSNPDPKLPPR